MMVTSCRYLARPRLPSASSAGWLVQVLRENSPLEEKDRTTFKLEDSRILMLPLLVSS